MANSGGGFGLIHFGNIDGIVGNDDMFRKPQAFLEFFDKDLIQSFEESTVAVNLTIIFSSLNGCSQR